MAPHVPLCYLERLAVKPKKTKKTQPKESVECLYAQGRLVEAAELLAAAIAKGETGALWNDWGVVYTGLAERAFRRAWELDPGNQATAANLGVLLFSTGKFGEAAPVLRKALPQVDGNARDHLASLLALSEAPAKARSQKRTRDIAQAKREIRDVLEQYFAHGDRSSNVATPPGYTPDLDYKPEWLDQVFARQTIHDEDYVVFGAFKDPDSVILDIGGNSGYSAASIWASGAASKVFSFEPNAGFADCLKRVAELRPGRFGYSMVALGDAAGSLDFAVPVINGFAITALATACSLPNLDCLADVIIEHFEKYMAAMAFEWFRMHRFTAQVTRLDDFLAEGRSWLSGDRIVAMKIDAESYEGHVLVGARKFLSARKPLILAEGAHTTPLVFETLLGLGYSYAGREGRRLETATGPVPAISGFFIHPDRFGEYQRSGLLTEECVAAVS
jgi:FkbM family methyltransferase